MMARKVVEMVIKEKFKKLAEILKKKLSEACTALTKLFPSGLKMKWAVNRWGITGMMAMDNKGGASEMMLEGNKLIKKA